jgi:exodeoxyribonuclease VII large subunit
MAVPVRAELMLQIDGLARRHMASWLRGTDARRKELRAAARALPGREALFAPLRQRLDGAADRLPRALRANAQIHLTDYSRAAARLVPSMLRLRVERERHRYRGAAARMRNAIQVLQRRRDERFSDLRARLARALRTNVEGQRVHIARCREKVQALTQRAHRATQTFILQRAATLDRAAQLLDAFSYRGVLARGFALVRDSGRRPLRSAVEVTPGLDLEIEFADGAVAARAQGAPTTFAPPRIARPRTKRSAGDPGQGNLFG